MILLKIQEERRPFHLFWVSSLKKIKIPNTEEEEADGETEMLFLVFTATQSDKTPPPTA